VSVRAGGSCRSLGLGLTVLALALLVPVPPVRGQATDCTGYDSQIWAQSIYESDPARYTALDPDGK
jgi:hypothetical protein